MKEWLQHMAMHPVWPSRALTGLYGVAEPPPASLYRMINSIGASVLPTGIYNSWER